MAFDEQIARALESFSSRLHEEVERQVHLVSDELAGMMAEVVKVPPPAPPESPEPDRGTASLADGVRAIGAASSLTEVLDTLVQFAAQHAARSAVLLVRGERFLAWRLRGFEHANAGQERLEIPAGDAGVIAEALRTGRLESGAPDGFAPAPEFARLPAGRPCAAVPMAISGHVVAVLYADAGGTAPAGPAADNWNGPESRNRAEHWNMDALEILGRHAARCLEALTAVKAARALSSHPAPMASRAASAPPLPSPAGDDTSEAHIAARRYARLLVSEIKLYHEPQVEEGRRARDLMSRLSGEIARARALYDQRVPPEIRERTDYIREELIRTLADGDANLLAGS
jgi:hypothetical protein